MQHESDGAPGATPNRVPGPNKFIAKLMQTWRLERAQCASMLGCTEHTLDEILSGAQTIQRARITDRFLAVFEIRGTLWSLFRDEGVENEWLREPHRDLAQRTPLELLCEGTEESVATATEYVWHAANPGGS